jgi:hypothetical protein
MALFLVTSRQTIYEQTEIEAENEQEALEFAFVNCSSLDWNTIYAEDFEPIKAIKLEED